MQPTKEQIEFRLAWLEKIEDDGTDNLDRVMEQDLERWIAHCQAQNWDAEAIDMSLGYC